jgi:acetyltransferase-like isoleucine patch superfamily enzyme
VIIFDNVKIGNGAIIGANSLVNKDIPAYSINVGSPAKIIRYRFSDKVISDLEKFKWWEKDFKWLKENYLDFSNIVKD